MSNIITPFDNRSDPIITVVPDQFNVSFIPLYAPMYIVFTLPTPLLTLPIKSSNLAYVLNRLSIDSTFKRAAVSL